jgi:hypothetical protein
MSKHYISAMHPKYNLDNRITEVFSVNVNPQDQNQCSYIIVIM